MQIYIDDMAVEARMGESLLAIVQRLGLDSQDLSKRPLAADLGGEVFTLNYVPCREQDKLPASVGFRERRGIRRSKGRISLIRYGENRGQRVYDRTLLFVFLLAVRELFPEAHVKVNYAIGAGLYITVKKDTPLVRSEVDALRRKCKEIVAADYVLERKRLDIDEAIAFFEKDGQTDKVRLLNYRQFTFFDIYRHGDYVDYFYGEMCPSTGYASVMNLQYEAPGLFLLRPSAKDVNKPSTYVKSPRFAAVFAESDRWAGLMHCSSVADLNDMVMNGSVRELIRVNEALHEKRFAEIASEIVARGARAILIAGPSSSGKTTSANRLCTQLRVLGKTPLLFSLDDYYKDRSLVEPEPDRGAARLRLRHGPEPARRPDHPPHRGHAHDHRGPPRPEPPAPHPGDRPQGRVQALRVRPDHPEPGRPQPHPHLGRAAPPAAGPGLPHPGRHRGKDPHHVGQRPAGGASVDLPLSGGSRRHLQHRPGL